MATEAEHTQHRLRRAMKSLDEAMFDVDQSSLKAKNARKMLEAEDADDLAALLGPALDELRNAYRIELALIKERIHESMEML